jgi:hypothetical protein
LQSYWVVTPEALQERKLLTFPRDHLQPTSARMPMTRGSVRSMLRRPPYAIWRQAICACAFLFTGTAAFAQGIVNPVVEGDSLRAEIDVGGFSASLVVRFENVVGLDASNLGLSARILDPLAADLASKLGAGVSLAGAFPLAVRIEPPASGGLSFSGVVSIELYTHDLQYTVGSPLRLYSAPVGGAFTDITTSLASGSVRSGGSKPDFSEFIIVADVRPLATVIGSKYAQLSALLARHAPSMSSELAAELQNLKNASEQFWRAGGTVTAITYIEAFAEKVKAHSGSDIPDVWRSSRDVTNVAGALRSTAATLRFSLTLASNAS